MPRRVSPFGPSGGVMSISAGLFFGSALYDPSSGLPAPPSVNRTLPSARNVSVVPGGGFSGFLPRVPLSPIHSPMRVGGSLAGGSFLAGAPAAMAKPINRD